MTPVMRTGWVSQDPEFQFPTLLVTHTPGAFAVGSVTDLVRMMRPGVHATVLVEPAWSLDPVPGWETGVLASGWRTYSKGTGDDRSVLHVASWGELDAARQPFTALPIDRAASVLEMWSHLTGTAWHGTPGVAGIDVMSTDLGSHAVKRPDKLGRGRQVPSHVHKQGLERDYTQNSWSGPAAGTGAVTIDANMAYLAAALTSELPARQLEHHDGDAPFGHVGYHLVTVDPWHYHDQLPHPMGYPPANIATGPTFARWITTPTLRLLRDVAAELGTPHPEVLQSWTAIGSRVLRPWAETLRDTITNAGGDASPCLTAMTKAAYREAIGLLGREGGRIYRPDWQSIIIAQSRATLWRKMWLAHEHGAVIHSVNVDAVTLSHITPNLRIAPGSLGAFKIKE